MFLMCQIEKTTFCKFASYNLESKTKNIFNALSAVCKVFDISRDAQRDTNK